MITVKDPVIRLTFERLRPNITVNDPVIRLRFEVSKHDYGQGSSDPSNVYSPETPKITNSRKLSLLLHYVFF